LYKVESPISEGNSNVKFYVITIAFQVLENTGFFPIATYVTQG
jgi:hypothetical protein